MKLFNKIFSRGFTLLEMTVTMGIVVFISALTFTSYKEGQSQYALQLSAQKLAADLRMTQNMALSTVVENGEQIAGGYGIYLDKNQKTNYRLFADANNVNPLEPAYDGPSSDSTINTIELKKGVEINTVSLDANSVESGYIIFTPPDPQITISGNSTELSIKVSLIKDSSKAKTVTINKFGKIDISN